MENIQSNFGKLNLMDILKGFILSILSAFITGVYTAISTGVIVTEESLKTMGMTALISGLAYLCKNFLTNSSGQPLIIEKKKEESEGTK